MTSCLPWILHELTYGLRGGKQLYLVSGAVQVGIISIAAAVLVVQMNKLNLKTLLM